MYRIVCESYENYKNDFLPNNTNDYRYRVMEPLALIVDLSLYKQEKDNNTINYQKLEDLIYLIKQDMEQYPRFKSFLWSLEARGIYGKANGLLSEEDFNELSKTINMFLKLSYWN